MIGQRVRDAMRRFKVAHGQEPDELHVTRKDHRDLLDEVEFLYGPSLISYNGVSDGQSRYLGLKVIKDLAARVSYVSRADLREGLKMSDQKPSIGRIVIFTLNESDADRINKRRSDTMAHLSEHQAASNGVQVHFGMSVKAGDQFPMMVTRVEDEWFVNGQVILDGNDVFWVTRRFFGNEQGEWNWPARV